MKSILLILGLSLCTLTGTVFGQGGKAEPNRIVFAPHTSSAVVNGTLSNGQEMDYVFTARAGQTVVIKNNKPSLFDLRVFNGPGDFETEFETSPTLTFEVPETGDYMFFVRKKQGKTPRRAWFSLTLSIK